MTWFRCLDSNGGGEQIIITPALITDVSGFTKTYSTSSDISYGSLGTKVSNALEITDADVLSAYMLGGWNESHACYYDAENKIGAYAGYDFGEEIHIERVKFWLGRYSGQNKTLYATVQWLDSLGNWNDFIDLEITSTIAYPINIFSIYLNKKCYGVRWIHKNGEEENSGNNIVFFGMILYRYVDIDVPSPIELYSFNQSQGGVWIDTYVDVTDFDALLFTYDTGTDDRLMRQIPKSDIAVYTGGTDVYTTIFTSNEIGKALNVRIYNDVLWVSFNGTGASTNVVTVYEPITF